MAFAQHIRMSMIGTFGPAGGGGLRTEAFTYSLNLSDPLAAEDPVDDENQAMDLAADAVAFHGSPTAKISAQAVLQMVKFARIGPDGRYLAAPRMVEVNQAGGGGALRYPFQIALAVSLSTERRGPSGRGRFFLPSPTFNLGAETGQFPTTEIADATLAVRTFLNAVNDQPGLEGNAPRVVVASSKGFNTDVTGVRIGTVPDTIRSRRRQLVETYSAIQAVS